MKLLCVGDCPMARSGFAVVMKNLLACWAASKSFERIDIWALGYDGHPGMPITDEQRKAGKKRSEFRKHPYVMYPAAPEPNEPWYSSTNLQELINLILQGDYTHFWIMQDHFLLERGNFPQALREACEQKKVKTLYYIPVDSDVTLSQARVAEYFDMPVAYTEYGRAQIEKQIGVLGGPKFGPTVRVIPHGVCTTTYFPFPADTRAKFRKATLPDVKDDDIVMLNVNANQPRKDVVRSLEILKELHARGFKQFKLVMNMSFKNIDGDDIRVAGEQLGLKHGQDWFCTGEFFKAGAPQMDDDELCKLYNVCDLYLTTSLGEGWGLGITEAMAVGLPVAVPEHTACAELADKFTEFGMGSRLIRLPLEKHCVQIRGDISRVRRRVDVDQAAQLIFERKWQMVGGQERKGLTPEAKQWLSWGRISEEWMKLIRRGETRSKHYYMEMGGGLGDIFNGLHVKGAYNILRDLRPDETATVALVTHNRFAREIFDNHPKVKSGQVQVLDMEWWTPEEDVEKRAAHRLPAPGGLHRLPDYSKTLMKPLEFYPYETDVPELQKIFDQQRPWILLAPGAGEPSRNIPDEVLTVLVSRLLVNQDFTVVQVGRSYDRHGRKEPSVEWATGRAIEEGRFINLVDKLSVPATALLVQNCVGLVTCHSALNILAWHAVRPQLLLYPEAVRKRHFEKRDQWSFGAFDPQLKALTAHGLFTEFNEEMFREFESMLWLKFYQSI